MWRQLFFLRPAERPLPYGISCAVFWGRSGLSTALGRLDEAGLGWSVQHRRGFLGRGGIALSPRLPNSSAEHILVGIRRWECGRGLLPIAPLQHRPRVASILLDNDFFFFLQEAENYGKNVAIFASFALSDIPGKDLSQEFSSESQNCAALQPPAAPSQCSTGPSCYSTDPTPNLHQQYFPPLPPE